MSLVPLILAFIAWALGRGQLEWRGCRRKTSGPDPPVLACFRHFRLPRQDSIGVAHMLRRQRAHKTLRPFRFQPRLERLEDRTVPTAFWGSFAGTAQHTAEAPVASAPLNQILWQTP